MFRPGMATQTVAALYPRGVQFIAVEGSMDRLAAMETFVAVVDSGSFSAAARKLNVGQPAVSKLIAQLEERLGVKLPVRTTRGLTATEAGLYYYERARRTIEEADEAEVAARGAARSLTGRLRVSAMVTFARIHLIPRIPQFLARHPELEMDVVLEDRNVDLIQEGIDVGLCMGHLADSSLTVQRIVNGRRGVFGTTAYFARAGEPKEPGDLAAHEAVIYDQKEETGRGGAVWHFSRDGEEVVVTLKGRLRVSAAEGVRAAVLAGAEMPSARNGCSRLRSQMGRLGRFCRTGSYPLPRSGRYSRPAGRLAWISTERN